MRRITLVLACWMALAVAGAGTAVADSFHGHHGGHHANSHYGFSGGGHYGHYGGGYWGGYSAGYPGSYGGGWCGAAPAYGYGYGIPVYSYGYPQAGFGVATRNFSLWFGQ